MIVGVIPCRYQSSRFPGKAIAEINGKPMVYHVWNQAGKAEILDRVVVATDDDRIYEECIHWGIEVILTADKHQTGTDRVAEVAEKVEGDVFVNIQGDEPLIDPQSINTVAGQFANDGNTIEVSNAYSIIDNKEAVANSNVVKVITTIDGFALAYSRSPIPYAKQGNAIYKRQIGLYAFTRDAILRYTHMSVGYIEETEGIEMYRYLENGHKVKMVMVEHEQSIAVDIPGDIVRVEEVMSRTGPEQS